MRIIAILIALIAPIAAQAGLLDLMPLRKIERKMLYPLSSEEVVPSELELKQTQVLRIDRETAEIVVWRIEAKHPARATVIYFHGNAGNLAVRAERFKILQSQGFNVIAMSYRSSSGSTGLPSEIAILADARHVFEMVPQLFPKVTPQDVILYGESLGAAVAIGLLSEIEADARPAGLILEAPFTSIPEMANSVLDVPDSLISRIHDRWESLARAPSITIPTLVMHGTLDEVTPTRMGRAIFDAVPINDKDFIAVKGASHSATWRSDTMPRIWRFIRTYGAP